MRERLAPAAVLACVAVVAGAASGGCGPGAAGTAAEREVRVAAASDLKFAMEDIIEGFEAGHPGTEVTVTYGSSGTFVQQIGNGAPFDVYLSADIGYAEDLVELGLADGSDVFRYAVGRLVVWAPEDSGIDTSPGLTALAGDTVDTVAIANPEHAPYGAAAVAALESAGVHDDVEDKLVLGENIAQAAEFVQSGNADVGVVALSLALSPGMRGSGDYTEVPLDLFPRLDQGGVVLANAAAPGAARELTGYLDSAEGQAILKDHGFFPPDSGGEG